MSQISDKYRPKAITDFVGNREPLEDLHTYITGKVPCVLVGPPGCGKTSAVHLIAGLLDFKVDIINSSDERGKEEIKLLGSRLKIKTLVKTIFLIEDCNNIRDQDLLAECISESTNPVVLTANDKYRLSQEIKKVCKLVEFLPPRLAEVVERMKYIAKQENLKVTYEGVSSDIRESINKVFYHSHGYQKEISDFDKVDDIFKKGLPHDIDLIWVLDNINNYYSGLDVYFAVQNLCNMVKTGEKRLLTCFPKSSRGKAMYPHFLSKQRNSKKKAF